MLRNDDFIKSQLLLRAWQEGKEYGGHLASMMIMSTIMNRVRLGWGNHLDVLVSIPKYSATLKQPDNVLPNLWDANFTRLLHEVDSIFDGSAKDLSAGALFWADLRNVDNDWFKQNILQKPEIHTRVADFNSLTFFK